MFRVTVVLGAVVVLAGGQARAALNWDIYGDALIVEGDVYNKVHIYDTPPGRTSVTMTGGLVDAAGAHDSSTFNISSGHVSSLSANDGATVSVSGEATVYSAYADELSTLNVSGGSMQAITASGYSMINISGGSVAWIKLGQHSIMNMSGGEVTEYYLDVLDSAIVNLHGGTVSRISGPGDRGEPFSGAINIYGYNLAKTNEGTPYGGYVSGYFLDDTPFTIYLQGPDVYARTNLIPEPGVLLLLALGGLIVRTRRR